MVEQPPAHKSYKPNKASHTSSIPKRQDKKIRVIISVLVVLIIGVGVLIYVRGRNPKISAPPNTAALTKIAYAPNIAVKLSSGGFSPSIVGIKTYVGVVWTNIDSSSHILTFFNYPSSSSFPNLNSKVTINKNEVYRIVFLKAGTYSYYDSLNPKLKGEVVVQL